MLKIFLDAGHGGKDPGAVGNNLQEKDIVLSMALDIGKQLEDNYECEVLYSRTNDTFLDLRMRAQIANQQGADFFLSLHINSHTTVTPNGYEDFIRPNAKPILVNMQSQIHSEVSKVWTKYNRANRGRKIANFAVLRHTRMPAVLVENGFIRNVEDAKLLRDKQFMNELINAHVNGIVKALSLEKRKPPQSNNTSQRVYIVQPDDTLWSIASSQLGNGTRFIEIRNLNNLTLDRITPGQRLILPQS